MVVVANPFCWMTKYWAYNALNRHTSTSLFALLSEFWFNQVETPVLCSGFGSPIWDFLANAAVLVVGLVLAKLPVHPREWFTHFLLWDRIGRKAKQAHTSKNTKKNFITRKYKEKNYNRIGWSFICIKNLWSCNTCRNSQKKIHLFDFTHENILKLEYI